jgi:hypothetical protein
MKRIVAQLTVLFFVTACVKKDVPVIVDPPPSATSNDVVLSFNAHADGKAFVPDTAWYTNSSGDKYTVTRFDYYISNISLIPASGTSFTETESYHLVKHVKNETQFTVGAVAPGSYTKVRFLIGVDSLRNVSGAQTGALAKENDMHWDWISGYIFLKLEGDFVATGSTIQDQYSIHIGGFTGPLGCLQWVEIDLPVPLVVDGSGTNAIRFKTNVNEIFSKPNRIGFADYYPVTNTIFKLISDNYRDMFTIDKVEN